MEVTENKVITLANNAKYFILDDLGYPADDPDCKYLFVIGVTPDWEFNDQDVMFIKNYQLNGEEVVEKVKETDPMYHLVSNLEGIKIRLEVDPKFRNELEQQMQRFE